MSTESREELFLEDGIRNANVCATSINISDNNTNNINNNNCTEFMTKVKKNNANINIKNKVSWHRILWRTLCLARPQNVPLWCQLLLFGLLSACFLFFPWSANPVHILFIVLSLFFAIVFIVIYFVIYHVTLHKARRAAEQEWELYCTKTEEHEDYSITNEDSNNEINNLICEEEEYKGNFRERRISLLPPPPLSFESHTVHQNLQAELDEERAAVHFINVKYTHHVRRVSTRIIITLSSLQLLLLGLLIELSPMVMGVWTWTHDLSHNTLNNIDSVSSNNNTTATTTATFIDSNNVETAVSSWRRLVYLTIIFNGGNAKNRFGVQTYPNEISIKVALLHAWFLFAFDLPFAADLLIGLIHLAVAMAFYHYESALTMLLIALWMSVPLISIIICFIWGADHYREQQEQQQLKEEQEQEWHVTHNLLTGKEAVMGFTKTMPIINFVTSLKCKAYGSAMEGNQHRNRNYCNREKQLITANRLSINLVTTKSNYMTITRPTTSALALSQAAVQSHQPFETAYSELDNYNADAFDAREDQLMQDTFTNYTLTQTVPIISTNAPAATVQSQRPLQQETEKKEQEELYAEENRNMTLPITNERTSHEEAEHGVINNTQVYSPREARESDLIDSQIKQVCASINSNNKHETTRLEMCNMNSKSNITSETNANMLKYTKSQNNTNIKEKLLQTLHNINDNNKSSQATLDNNYNHQQHKVEQRKEYVGLCHRNMHYAAKESSSPSVLYRERVQDWRSLIDCIAHKQTESIAYMLVDCENVVIRYVNNKFATSVGTVASSLRMRRLYDVLMWLQVDHVERLMSMIQEITECNNNKNNNNNYNTTTANADKTNIPKAALTLSASSPKQIQSVPYEPKVHRNNESSFSLQINNNSSTDCASLMNKEESMLTFCYRLTLRGKCPYNVLVNTQVNKMPRGKAQKKTHAKSHELSVNVTNRYDDNDDNTVYKSKMPTHTSLLHTSHALSEQREENHPEYRRPPFVIHVDVFLTQQRSMLTSAPCILFRTPHYHEYCNGLGLPLALIRASTGSVVFWSVHATTLTGLSEYTMLSFPLLDNFTLTEECRNNKRGAYKEKKEEEGEEEDFMWEENSHIVNHMGVGHGSVKLPAGESLSALSASRHSVWYSCSLRLVQGERAEIEKYRTEHQVQSLLLPRESDDSNDDDDDVAVSKSSHEINSAIDNKTNNVINEKKWNWARFPLLRMWKEQSALLLLILEEKLASPKHNFTENSDIDYCDHTLNNNNTNRNEEKAFSVVVESEQQQRQQQEEQEYEEWQEQEQQEEMEIKSLQLEEKESQQELHGNATMINSEEVNVCTEHELNHVNHSNDNLPNNSNNNNRNEDDDDNNMHNAIEQDSKEILPEESEIYEEAQKSNIVKVEYKENDTNKRESLITNNVTVSNANEETNELIQLTDDKSFNSNAVVEEVADVQYEFLTSLLPATESVTSKSNIDTAMLTTLNNNQFIVESEHLQTAHMQGENNVHQEHVVSNRSRRQVLISPPIVEESHGEMIVDASYNNNNNNISKSSNMVTNGFTNNDTIKRDEAKNAELVNNVESSDEFANNTMLLKENNDKLISNNVSNIQSNDNVSNNNNNNNINKNNIESNKTINSNELINNTQDKQQGTLLQPITTSTDQLAAPQPPWGQLLSRDEDTISSCLIRVPLDEPFKFGRSSRCELCVHDSFVSSVQFTLTRTLRVQYKERKAKSITEDKIAKNKNVNNDNNNNDSNVEADISKEGNLKEIASRSFVVTLQDKSVNGTYVNVKKIGKDKTCILHDGDLITFRLSTSQFFLGFVFRLLHLRRRNGFDAKKRHKRTTSSTHHAVNETKLEKETIMIGARANNNDNASNVIINMASTPASNVNNVPENEHSRHKKTSKYNDSRGNKNSMLLLKSSNLSDALLEQEKEEQEEQEALNQSQSTTSAPVTPNTLPWNNSNNYNNRGEKNMKDETQNKKRHVNKQNARSLSAFWVQRRLSNRQKANMRRSMSAHFSEHASRSQSSVKSSPQEIHITRHRTYSEAHRSRNNQSGNSNYNDNDSNINNNNDNHKVVTHSRDNFLMLPPSRYNKSNTAYSRDESDRVSNFKNSGSRASSSSFVYSNYTNNRNNNNNIKNKNNNNNNDNNISHEHEYYDGGGDVRIREITSSSPYIHERESAAKSSSSIYDGSNNNNNYYYLNNSGSMPQYQEQVSSSHLSHSSSMEERESDFRLDANDDEEEEEEEEEEEDGNNSEHEELERKNELQYENDLHRSDWEYYYNNNKKDNNNLHRNKRRNRRHKSYNQEQEEKQEQEKQQYEKRQRRREDGEEGQSEKSEEQRLNNQHHYEHRHHRKRETIEWKIGEEMLGKGGNAEVYLGINLTNGQLIAVKRVLLPTAINDVQQDPSTAKAILQQYRSLQEEINVLSKAIHPNIVRYYGSSQNKTYFNILLEFVPGGSLRHLLDNFGALSPGVIFSYLRQALEGLRYLHAREIVHGDIKTANILISEKGQAKLTDFGTARLLNRQHASMLLSSDNKLTEKKDNSEALSLLQNTLHKKTNDGEKEGGNGSGNENAAASGGTVGSTLRLGGTLRWMDPSLFRGANYTNALSSESGIANSVSAPPLPFSRTGPSKASDIWSMGCALIEMMSGEGPWYEYEFESEEQIINLLKYTTEPPEIPECAECPYLMSIAQMCLQLNPELRPTCDVLLSMVIAASERLQTQMYTPSASPARDSSGPLPNPEHLTENSINQTDNTNNNNNNNNNNDNDKNNYSNNNNSTNINNNVNSYTGSELGKTHEGIAYTDKNKY